jgi:predicted RNA-binding protein
MCLAKVYFHAASAAGAAAGAMSGDDGAPKLVMENVTRLTVDGDRIGLTSLLGATQEVTGRVVSMDFMEGRLLLESTEPTV